MPATRRGIVLPAVLAAMISLALLSALALMDAVQEYRVATLADDHVLARAALHEALDAAAHPQDLALLCVSAPLARQSREERSTGGGTRRLAWSHLGRGLVRVEAEGQGRTGARARAIALLRADSVESGPLGHTCSRATRLEPNGVAWVVAHPEG